MNKILLIDDNVLLGRMIKESLLQQSFEVDIALDANEGYKRAIENVPDLILLDVQLPDVAGSDLIRILKHREELSHIPIIMITGTHHETDHKVKAFQAGADDYVLKPFEMPELVERMRAVLRRSQVRPSPAPAPVVQLVHSKPSPSVREQTKSLKSLSLKEVIRRTLAAPSTLIVDRVPPVTIHYLVLLLGLALGGWMLSAGSTAKPVLIGLGTVGFWGLCVSVLVITCSILGISLTWKEGARLLSVAGLPILVKLLGGFVVTLLTSLSPFYFTAGPLFELWVAALLGMFIQQCRGATRQKAYVAALLVLPVLLVWQNVWKH